MHCPADAMGGVPAPRPPRATPAARIKPLTIRRRPRLLVAFAAREALIRSKEPWDPFCASILTSPLGGFPECHFASDPPCACSGEAHLPQQTRKQLLQHPTWGERYHGKSPYLKLKIAICFELLISGAMAICDAERRALLRRLSQAGRGGQPGFP